MPLLPLLSALVAITAPALAQPLKPGSVVLRVETEQIVRRETQWSTSWGSFSRDLINARVLVIALRQLGPGQGPVTVRWWFVGRDYDLDVLFIYDSGETTGKIAAGGVKLAPSSRELVLNREQTLLLGRQTSGQHPWGWCVAVSQDGRLLAETASLPELVEWTKKTLQSGQKPPQRSKRKVEFVAPMSAYSLGK